jgi:hypothetical protein
VDLSAERVPWRHSLKARAAGEALASAAIATVYGRDDGDGRSVRSWHGNWRANGRSEQSRFVRVRRDRPLSSMRGDTFGNNSQT